LPNLGAIYVFCFEEKAVNKSALITGKSRIKKQFSTIVSMGFLSGCSFIMFAPMITQADLVQIVSQYTSLQEGRKVMKGNCPFHEDLNFSFKVYPSNNIFKCFACGLEGGPAEFLEKIGQSK